MVDFSIITSNSDIIILNVLLFFLFALIGSFDLRRKEKKSQAGAIAATTIIVAESFGFSQRLASVASFIVGFFIQMQGLAVSAYALLWLFGQDPSGYLEFGYMLEIPGIAIFGIGCALVILGWEKIFDAKNKFLVTDGLYKYVRHPQYLGILIATLRHGSLQVFTYFHVALDFSSAFVLQTGKERREDHAELLWSAIFGIQIRGPHAPAPKAWKWSQPIFQSSDKK